MHKPLRVALFGLGTVGRAVAERLLDPTWADHVARRGMVPPRLVAVGVRDPDRDRGVTLPPEVRRSDDLESLAVDPDVDVVVELIGAADSAATIIEKALASGRPAVTANKRLVASEGARLEALARQSGAALRFEAAVAGGVPVLGPLVTDLAANRITRVRGIVNGTTNQILSQMAEEGRSYDEVLREAQQRGLAEADPSSDVEGHDAASKLVILARLAFGGWLRPDALRRSVPTLAGESAPGISGVERAHLARAADLGLRLKLVARMGRLDGDAGLAGGVTVMAVPAASAIGATSGVSNIVEVTGEPVGRVGFRGPGAGGAATSSAVLGDLLAIARGEWSTWDPLPPAADVGVLDDVEQPHAWLVVLDMPFLAALPAGLADLALASSGNAVVTRPVSLADLRVVLTVTGLAAAGVDVSGPSATLYPLLPDA